MKNLEAKLIRLALKEYNKLDSVISRITERKPTKADRDLNIGSLFEMLRFYKLLCEKHWEKAYKFYGDCTYDYFPEWSIPNEIKDPLMDILKPIWNKNMGLYFSS